MNGQTLYLAEFMKKLKELNSDINIDTTGKNVYFGGEGEAHRTGIFFKTEHICNIDKGFIPEFNVKGGGQINLINVSPTYALNHRDTCITQHIIVDSSNIMMLGELNRKLGTKETAEVSFGTYTVMASREKVVTQANEFDDAILVRRYVKREVLPCHIVRIGWRQLCELLINKKIPGVTREKLGEALNTTLRKGYTDAETFADVKKKAEAVL